MEPKLYPTLPTAPTPDPTLERYNRVNIIYNELKLMKDRRNNSYKKYSKATSILQKTSIAFSSIAAVEAVAGIATSLTVVGFPAGIVLTGLAGFSGICSLILTPIEKHCVKKKMKHAKMRSIIETGIAMLDKKISKILNDHIVDDKEFNDIVNEYEKIKNLLYTFDINKLKDDMKKEIVTELQK